MHAGAMCNACALRVVLDNVTELRSTVSFRLSKQRTTLYRIISQCHGFLTVPHTSRLPLKSAKCLPFPFPLAAVKELILEHGGVSKRVSENQPFWILKNNDFCVNLGIICRLGLVVETVKRNSAVSWNSFALIS